MQTNIQALTGSDATLILRDSQSTRLDVKLVGLRDNKYLIASFSGREESLKHAKANRKYLVRVRKENVVHVFNASLAKVEGGDIPLVHLSVNQDVINSKRKTPRVTGDNTKIKLSLLSGGKSINVTMADISVAGARLVSDRRLGNIDDIFVIEVKSRYSDECLNVRCKIRHLRTQVEESSRSRIVFHHGVEFLEIDEVMQGFLDQFVRETVH